MIVNARLIAILLSMVVIIGCTPTPTPQPTVPTPRLSPTPPDIPTDFPATAEPTITMTATTPPTGTSPPTLTATITTTPTITITPTITPSITFTPSPTPLPGRTPTNTPTTPTLTPTPLANLLTNPGFEDGFTGWTVSNSATSFADQPQLVSFSAQTGDDFLLMEGGETTAFNVVQSVSESGVNGDTIVLAFYQRTEGIVPPDCRVIVNAEDGGSVVSTNETNTLIGEQPGWAESTVTLTANADFDTLTVIVQCSGGSAGDYRGFDTFDLQTNP